ncbi:MAG: hypothetical protein KBC00_03015 [Candidatus Levybacteria bacterium]|nr:hypothetical protein [Candidatus Levybacteria bacterium]MBP9815332.1 hypothetical protein [Candidatus Levybacteria bacterium]
MHTYALIGSSNFQETYLSSFIKTHHVPAYHVIKLESCKIAQVRLLQHTMSLKLKEGEMRVIIIASPTLESQNALLKTVEEATSQNAIFFVSSTKDELLPTILSRCLIVNLENEKKEMDVELFNKISKVFEESQYNTFGIVSLLPAIIETENIESILLALRSLIKEDLSRASVILPVLRKLHNSYKLTKTNNVNKRLALEASLL